MRLKTFNSITQIIQDQVGTDVEIDVECIDYSIIITVYDHKLDKEFLTKEFQKVDYWLEPHVSQRQVGMLKFTEIRI